MNLKIFQLLVVFHCYTTFTFALRKTPKIYNALITTDENLTSSRAYPVIQPTFQESGILHHPYYPYYLPSSYVGGIGGIGYPGLQNRFIGSPISHQQFIPGNQPGLLAKTPNTQTPQVGAVTTQAETAATAGETETKQEKLPPNPNEQLIPRLPPALIPLQRYPPSRNPYLSHNPRQLLPNSFYAQTPPYLLNQHGQYLPNFYNNDPRYNLALQPGNEHLKPIAPKETPEVKISNTPTDEKDDKQNDVNIKENIVPDVPPPPVPSGVNIKENIVPDVPPPPVPSGGKTE